ncbi:MAG: phosphate ABC transporter substrate-binding protein [Betaproteobacteria bacterium]|nr:phosphate ABC transporter substrate-binding protein [Betaproteobacteria bacterium]
MAVLSVATLFSTTSHAAESKLVMTGSSTVAPLAAEIAKRFEQQNPGVRVDVQSGGSGRGVNDARSGVANIGLVSRALKAEEQDLKSFTIALDGVAVIVHKSNPIKMLTREQIIAIYTGKISNWKEVGGRDQTITVVNKAEGRSTLELFAGHFQLKNSDIKAQVVIGDNPQGIKTVVGNPGAIGYVSIGSAEFEVEQGAALKLLPLDGVAATTDNVRNGKFPLSRPLNLVTKGEPAGLARQFIDFARSPKVLDLVKEQYFVPLSR